MPTIVKYTYKLEETHYNNGELSGYEVFVFNNVDLPVIERKYSYTQTIASIRESLKFEMDNTGTFENGVEYPKTGTEMPDPPEEVEEPKPAGGATPMDTNPAVVEGKYPSEDYHGAEFADKGVNANKLRQILKSLGYRETRTVIASNQWSGPQLDNGGDISNEILDAASCVFFMIKKIRPDLKITVTAGNNTFYKYFKNEAGEILDNNHRRGYGLNFTVSGVSTAHARNDDLTEKEKQILDDVEEILQRISAGNKYFQYINEYTAVTKKGDHKYNFHISVSGAPVMGMDEKVWVRTDKKGKTLEQGAMWWEGFNKDNVETNYTYVPAQREGNYFGFSEGLKEKEMSIELAKNNQLPIIDIKSVNYLVQDEYNIEFFTPPSIVVEETSESRNSGNPNLFYQMSTKDKLKARLKGMGPNNDKLKTGKYYGEAGYWRENMIIIGSTQQTTTAN